MDFGVEKASEDTAAAAESVEGVEVELGCDEEDDLDGQLEEAGSECRRLMRSCGSGFIIPAMRFVAGAEAKGGTGILDGDRK